MIHLYYVMIQGAVNTLQYPNKVSITSSEVIIFKDSLPTILYKYTVQVLLLLLLLLYIYYYYYYYYIFMSFERKTVRNKYSHFHQ